MQHTLVNFGSLDCLRMDIVGRDESRRRLAKLIITCPFILVDWGKHRRRILDGIVRIGRPIMDVDAVVGRYVNRPWPLLLMVLVGIDGTMVDRRRWMRLIVVVVVVCVVATSGGSSSSTWVIVGWTSREVLILCLFPICSSQTKRAAWAVDLEGHRVVGDLLHIMMRRGSSKSGEGEVVEWACQSGI